METRPENGTGQSEDGVDVTLIRWMLSLSPLERLRVLEDHVNGVLAIRESCESASSES